MDKIFIHFDFFIHTRVVMFLFYDFFTYFINVSFFNLCFVTLYSFCYLIREICVHSHICFPHYVLSFSFWVLFMFPLFMFPIFTQKTLPCFCADLEVQG